MIISYTPQVTIVATREKHKTPPSTFKIEMILILQYLLRMMQREPVLHLSENILSLDNKHKRPPSTHFSFYNEKFLIPLVPTVQGTQLPKGPCNSCRTAQPLSTPLF